MRAATRQCEQEEATKGCGLEADGDKAAGHAGSSEDKGVWPGKSDVLCLRGRGQVAAAAPFLSMF